MDGPAESTMSKGDRHDAQSIAAQVLLAHRMDAGSNSQLLSEQSPTVIDQSNGAAIKNHDEASSAPTVTPVHGEIQGPNTKANPTAQSLSADSDHTTAVEGANKSDFNPQLFSVVKREQHGAKILSPGSTSQLDDDFYPASQPYPPESESDLEGSEVQAFAKLEFDDGEFYMNTYAVVLGRDLETGHRSRGKSAAEGSSQSRSRRQSSSRVGSANLEKVGRKGSDGAANVRPDDNAGLSANKHRSGDGKRAKMQKFEFSSPSSRQHSRKSSAHSPRYKRDYNKMAMDSLGLEGSMPSPDQVPFVPVHSPSRLEGPMMSRKTISRQHIKIEFDFEYSCFSVRFLGRNGGFVDEQWYTQWDTIALTSGSKIQIGGVVFRFVLPNVPPEETGAEIGLNSDPLSGTLESFDMTNSSGGQSGVIEAEEDEEEEEEEEGEEEDEEEEEADDVDVDDGDENATAATRKDVERDGRIPRTRRKAQKNIEVTPPPPPKRKGPGRPPKNGIRSKREQALLAKQAKESAKAKAEGKPVVASNKVEKKNNRVVKGSTKEESSLQPNGKRKYTKRKRAGGTEEQQAVQESTEHTDSVPPETNEADPIPPKVTKEKKPSKPPRSPSPVFDESQLTAEQLAKPSSSYVVLIHEALTNSPTGQMSLPQIYRAIERRYPFFKLRVQTQGWQSSVRHNLSQHPAFRKIERDGKGWMWGLVPEVSIEKEKKRRATPPPATQQQQYYPQNPHMRPSYPSYPPVQHPNGHFPPRPNGHMPPAPYAGYPSQPPPMGRLPYQPPPPHLGGFPLPIVNAQSESTYRSPYQSTPPPRSSQPPSQSHQAPVINGTNGSNGTNGHQLPIVTQAPPGNTNGTTIAYPHHPSPAMHPSANYDRGQDFSGAVSRFKTALIDTMEDKVLGEKLVTSAINRVLGVQQTSSMPNGEEDPSERAIMDKFKGMLDDLDKKNEDAKKGISSMPSNYQTVNPNGAPLQYWPGSSSTAVAADNVASTALTSGNGASTHVTEMDKSKGVDAGTKRPLEEGNGPQAADSDQPRTKRVASGTPDA